MDTTTHTAPAFTLTVIRRGGDTEVREFDTRKQGTEAFEHARGNLLVRDAVLTSPRGIAIASHHA